MDKPHLLDLCCCSGGAGAGFKRARFRVTGVDIVDRPRYPSEFIKADARDVLREVIAGNIKADAVHASPPCQRNCTLTKGTNAALAERYEDIYDDIRDLMYATGLPGTIENPSARADVTLCGEMFGLRVIRHRKIELVNWATAKPEHKPHRGRVRGYRHGVWHDGPYIAAYGNGGGKASIGEMQEGMGIYWTDVREELTEAIPPAYAEWIGERLLREVERVK